VRQNCFRAASRWFTAILAVFTNKTRWQGCFATSRATLSQPKNCDLAAPFLHFSGLFAQLLNSQSNSAILPLTPRGALDIMRPVHTIPL
jgi:hypothetical protein